MKTEQELKKMLEELRERRSSSSNMNYEISGAEQALNWVLDDNSKSLSVGRRF